MKKNNTSALFGRGKAAQASGERAERVIIRMFELYAKLGVAQAMHLPILMRQVGPGRLIPVRPSPFDFMGQVRMERVGPCGHRPGHDVWMPDGKGSLAFPLAIELKRNQKARKSMEIIPAKKKGAGLAMHQLAALREWCWGRGGGGLALVLWWNGDRWYRLLPPAIRETWADVAQGIHIIPIARFEPVAEDVGGIVDFLGGVRFEARTPEPIRIPGPEPKEEQPC